MKRQFCELHARETEYCDDELFECTHQFELTASTTTASTTYSHTHTHLPPPPPSSNNSTPSKCTSSSQAIASSASSAAAAAASSATLNSLIINSCCRKCKNCFRHLSGLNARPNDVALRLKEKSKKKKEQAKAEQEEKEQAAALMAAASANTSPSRSCSNHNHHNKDRDSIIMNSDDGSESGDGSNGSQCMHHHMHSHSAGSSYSLGRRSKSRTSSDSEGVCTLEVDCKCKTCIKRQKLVDELLAEEESSKKKKAKKKKKKNAKKGGPNNETVDEEPEDFDPNDPSGKPDTEDEDSHGHHHGHGRSANHSGIVDPTSVDINQWIKVKNKYSGKLPPESAKNSSKTSSNSILSATHDPDEMESNGFKLIGGGHGQGGDKRRNSNLESVTKEMDALALADAKNGSPITTAIQKAKLLAIDANMAYLRGEILDAIHLITECIENDPKSPVYFINRSYYHERNKDYFNALKDAEAAIRLEESIEEYLEYSLYRKAKALGGLERYELVEPVLQSIVKLLQHKTRNNPHAMASILLKIDKDLMINRLKKLVSSDYTLPLARLYAIKFDTIALATEALDGNCRLLENAGGEALLDLQTHLKLIDHQLRMKDPTGHSAKSSHHSLKSIIKTPSRPMPQPIQPPPPPPPKQVKQLTSRDLWNFNEFDEDLDARLGALVGDDADEEEEVVKDNFDEDVFGLDLGDSDGDDSEIYFSDEDEYEMMYSHPDKWHSPKDILQLNSGTDHFFTDELKDPINSKGQKALWIGNVSPHCSVNLVTNVFMKFGSVTFCKIFPNERTNEVAYLLLHYDNDISPRLDKVIPGISKDDLPLIIRFRNKNDKAEGAEGEGGTTTATGTSVGSVGATLTVGSPQSGQSHHLTAGHGSPNLNTSGGSANKQLVSECYYWRTTGCDRERCSYKHIPAHKGIDKQSWMRRKN